MASGSSGKGGGGGNRGGKGTKIKNRTAANQRQNQRIRELNNAAANAGAPF